MKLYLSHILKSVLVALFCASALFAQAGAPNGWNGMTLDASTPEDAIRLFGAPVKDKDKQSLEILHSTSWLSGKQDEKIFRTISYKNLKDYKYVQFSFLDNKLVLISLEMTTSLREPNWIDPDDLESLFGVEFKPYALKAGQTRPSPADFKANAPSELPTKGGYNYWYHLMAVAGESFVLAVANNDKKEFGGVIPTDPTSKTRRKAINSQGDKYPGFVQQIQIISRKLAAK
jgi:hypothetical protein